MNTYLITGGGGFIGSHLSEVLLERGHQVRILDDFSTGRRQNLATLEGIELIEGSICDLSVLQGAMAGVDGCFHLAAIPSVPRSVAHPDRTNHANVDGSVAVFMAARDAGVKRVLYASSSSVYGDAPPGPLREDRPMAPKSPYGVSKAAGEMYARSFSLLYGLEIVGLRYFNVFGPNQDPKSAYAAVIPLFIRQALAGETLVIHGDGSQSRDFTYVDNVVDANIRAMESESNLDGVYNVACGASTSVLDIARFVLKAVGSDAEPQFEPKRLGDIMHSQADISRASEAFGYAPSVTVLEGIQRMVERAMA